MSETHTTEKDNCCDHDHEELKKNESQTEEPVVATEETKVSEEQSFKEKFYYLAAEMDNAKKRFEREKVNLIKYGLEGTLKDLVEVVDNFERTVDALKNDQEEKVKNIVVGINMVRDQFLGVLKKQGLAQIEAQGKDFDPNFHEALTSQEVPGTKAGVIVSEFQKGYVLNGRLLRASKVVVSK